MPRIIYIYGRNEDVLLGQEDHCDALAYVVRNADGNSWRLVRGDDSALIYVNGELLHLVHYLTSGDRITFDDGETVYRFAGPERDSDADRKSRVRSAVFSAAALAAVLLFMVVYQIFRIDEDDIRRSEIRRYEASVFKMTVKEVIYQSVRLTDEKIIVDTLGIAVLDTDFPSGSAFLCSDGKFVTARHCLEPWIAAEHPEAGYEDNDRLISWAAEAETFNLTKGNDTLFRRLVSVCEVSRNVAVAGHVTSDSFLYSVKNDRIRNMRGVNDPLYWRDLGHIRNKSSLGDIAYMQTSFKGSILLADHAEVDSLKMDLPALHLGYPAGHPKLGIERSRLFIDPQPDRCLEFNDTDVGKGYSGGPVMMRFNKRLYAVGVLSRILSKDERKCFCVPVSEIHNAEVRWDE